MTVTTGEDSQAIEDRFFTAEDPPDLAGPQAPADANAPPPDDPERAPYGWTRDTGTHLWRPKKSPGRPKSTPPPGPDEVAAGPALEPEQDQAPPERDRGREPPPTGEDTPMPRGGVIAKGVDRLYRRAGRILKILAPELGLAVIECTKPDPDDPDAPTVGQAWEALARDNPRIRAWLLGLLKGGTWQDLVMAHAPIAMALLTYDWVRRLIPGVTLERVAEAFLTQDAEEGDDLEPDGLTPADVGEMRDMAEAQAQHIASRLGVKVPPGVAAAAMKQAEAMQAAREAPEVFRRTQPPRNSRAKRKAGR